jgi:hypothetical protein
VIFIDVHLSMEFVDLLNLWIVQLKVIIVGYLVLVMVQFVLSMTAMYVSPIIFSLKIVQIIVILKDNV